MRKGACADSPPADGAVQLVVVKAKGVHQGHSIWPQLPQQLQRQRPQHSSDDPAAGAQAPCTAAEVPLCLLRLLGSWHLCFMPSMLLWQGSVARTA